MSANIHALVPAAGLGERLDSAVPKQYLQVAGRTVLEHTLDALARHALVSGITVVLARGDDRFEKLVKRPRDTVVSRVQGGATRAESVLNGLAHLAQVGGIDWVMVHDAARPCIDGSSLDRLIEAALNHPAGAILALPVRDTLKRDNGAGAIRATENRRGLWGAQTPQMFRLPLLLDALRAALDSGVAPTDEAQAMERAGHSPALVMGSARNLKITWPGDLELVDAWLNREQAR